MKKIYLFLMLFCCISTAVSAQTEEENRSLEREIKVSEAYFYGEYTAETSEAAIAEATNLLKTQVSEAGLTFNNIQSAQHILLPRGNKTRAIVYVKKTDVSATPTAPAIPDNNAMPVAPTDASSGVTNKPAPAPVTPTTTESKSPEKAEKTTKTENAKSSKSKKESSKSSKQEEIVDPVQNTDVPAEEVMAADLTLLEQILTASDAYQLSQLFAKEKNKGKMAYGNMNTMSYPENSYLMVYKTDGTILAIYDKGDKMRKNLYTNAVENHLEKFPGAEMLWFQIY